VIEVALEIPEHPTQESPLYVQIRSDDADVVGFTVMLLQQEEDGRMINRGLLGGDLLTPQKSNTFAWDGSVSELQDEAESQAISPQPWILGAASDEEIKALISVPGQLLDDEELARDALLLFSTGTDQAGSMVVTEEGQLRAVDASQIGCERPGARFRPLRGVRLPDGTFVKEPGTPVALRCNQRPTRIVRPVAPGPHALLIAAVDAWGNISLNVRPFLVSP
jgi:hypothetical protein